MAGYRLLIKPSAAKEIERIGSKRDRQRIVSRISSLGADPLPVGREKLAGAASLYRIRQGHYRVLYSVDHARRTIEVIRIGHRGDVYRDAFRRPSSRLGTPESP